METVCVPISMLSLPDAPEKVQKLRNKLMEYLDRQQKNLPQADHLDAIYKTIIIQYLFRQRKITISQLYEAVQGKLPEHKIQDIIFENAIGVIHSYCHGFEQEVMAPPQKDTQPQMRAL